MYSIAFPNMFTNSRTNLLKDGDATLSNLKLLLGSERSSLLGDPYYGSLLKRVIYEQQDQILRDLIIDEIYTAIQTFMPQIVVLRKDITVISDGVSIYTTIRYTNLLDGKVDLYDIKLTSTDEE